MRPTLASLTRALLCSSLLLAACSIGPTGAAPTGAGGPPAAPSAPAATTPPEALFAALEPGGSGAGIGTIDTAVAIVGLDGVARAKATFTPRRAPVIFDAGAILQPEARVVTGGVLYVDGTGQVRRLTTGGATSDVATFTFATQQELSFAASPDGAHLMAVRFSLPPLKANTAADPSDIYAPGDYTQDVLAADAGRAPALLGHQSWPQSTGPKNVLFVVGWTNGGPVATTASGYATQNPMPGQRLFGQLVHLDLAGHAGAAIGGPDCHAWDFLADDTVLCASTDLSTVSIRTGAGQPLFTLPNSGGHSYADLRLSPDGSRFTVQDLAQNDRAMVADRSGNLTALPVGFTAEGWLDASTIVGVGPPSGNMQYVRLGQPARAVDLGFKGLFVGPVTG